MVSHYHKWSVAWGQLGSARFPSRSFYDGTLSNGPDTLLRQKIQGLGATDDQLPQKQRFRCEIHVTAAMMKSGATSLERACDLFKHLLPCNWRGWTWSWQKLRWRLPEQAVSGTVPVIQVFQVPTIYTGLFPAETIIDISPCTAGGTIFFSLPNFLCTENTHYIWSHISSACLHILTNEKQTSHFSSNAIQNTPSVSVQMWFSCWGPWRRIFGLRVRGNFGLSGWRSLSGTEVRPGFSMVLLCQLIGGIHGPTDLYIILWMLYCLICFIMFYLFLWWFWNSPIYFGRSNNFIIHNYPPHQ